MPQKFESKLLFHLICLKISFSWTLFANNPAFLLLLFLLYFYFFLSKLMNRFQSLFYIKEHMNLFTYYASELIWTFLTKLNYKFACTNVLQNIILKVIGNLINVLRLFFANSTSSCHIFMCWAIKWIEPLYSLVVFYLTF